MRNALHAPEPDEPVHGEHVLNGTRVALDRAGHAPPQHTAWMWRLPDAEHTLSWDGARWVLDGDRAAPPDVVVETTPRAWAAFVATPVGQRSFAGLAAVEGTPGAVEAFRRAFLGT